MLGLLLAATAVALPRAGLDPGLQQAGPAAVSASLTSHQRPASPAAYGSAHAFRHQRARDAGTSGAGVASGRPAGSSGASAGRVPGRLVVPALGVDAPVVPITLSDGGLVPPADPHTLGWWDGGARPGASHGTAVLTGHTVHSGGGALDDLGSLRSGDRVEVDASGAALDYVVRSVAVYPKTVVAREAARLFSRTGPGRLALVTCTDWDGAEYLSNVVVLAAPARS